MKIKACILSVADLRHMTCANYYCEYFKNNGISFDIICMQRYTNKSNSIYECGLYQYKRYINTQASILTKFKAFKDFKKYANKIIEEKKYDFIVVWGENASWLFHKELTKHGNYCINIRDYLLGYNRIFEHSLKKALKYSKFNVVPSPKCMNYLNKEYVLMLNKDYQVLNCYTKPIKFVKNDRKIIITYMGLIKEYQEAFSKILLYFKNDPRFILRFYGNGADTELKEFAYKNSISNSQFYGAFSPELTAKILEETDIINSMYGNTNSGVTDAVGVKESYAPLLHIPVISDKGCYFANLSEEYGFGKGFSIEENMNDYIYDWYSAINASEFDNGCTLYTKYVERTNEKIEKRLNNICVEEKKL